MLVCKNCEKEITLDDVSIFCTIEGTAPTSLSFNSGNVGISPDYSELDVDDLRVHGFIHTSCGAIIDEADLHNIQR